LLPGSFVRLNAQIRPLEGELRHKFQFTNLRLDDGTEIKTTWAKKGEAMFPGAYAWSYPDKYVCKIVCDFHEGPVNSVSNNLINYNY
jgi:hypothetical protein